MKRLILFSLLLSCRIAVGATPTNAVERIIYHCHTNGFDSVTPGTDFDLREDDGIVSMPFFNVPGCPPPVMTNLPASGPSLAYFRDLNYGGDNKRKSPEETRQELKAFRDTLKATLDASTNLLSNINTNPAFTAAQQKILKDQYQFSKDAIQAVRDSAKWQIQATK